MLTHEYFMRQALKEATNAFENDEVPVGAVVVCRNVIIARAHNQTELLNDVTAHAEILALTAAVNHLGSKYLNECILYVTLEPCAMCAGAMYWAQLDTLVFGAFDLKRGYSKLTPPVLHPKTKIINGVLDIECAQLLTGFFKRKR